MNKWLREGGTEKYSKQRNNENIFDCFDDRYTNYGILAGIETFISIVNLKAISYRSGL